MMKKLAKPAVVLGLSLIAVLILAPQAQANTLAVSVEGLRNSDGKVRVALWREPQTFPSDDGVYQRQSILAEADGVIVAFEDLQPGSYAIAVFHDENGNGDFDQGLFGIPLEGYGFGRDAPVRFGPPDFEQAAVSVKDGHMNVTVTMRY